MGISYGGISQLFTAATRPPSLAAIAPLSVLDNTQTTLYPGGILNTGFAVEWAKERVHDAQPASPTQGQPWAYKRIQEGDQVCKENQALHGQAVNLLAKVKANSHYVPKVADPLAPITFVDKIDVPTFMACQWTDEQTGGHCPDLAEHFTGTRPASGSPSPTAPTSTRWTRRPSTAGTTSSSSTSPGKRRSSHSAVIHTAAPLIYPEAMGIPGVTLPPDPVQQQPTYDGGAGRLRSPAAGPRPLRQRRRQLLARQALPGLRTVLQRVPDPRHRGPRLVPLDRRRPAQQRRPRARMPTASPGTRAPCRRPTSAATPPPAPAASGPRRPNTTGRRARPTARSPT